MDNATTFKERLAELGGVVTILGVDLAREEEPPYTPFEHERFPHPRQCSVRGHPPGPLSYLRFAPERRYSPLGVGGAIEPSRLPWPKGLT